MDRYSHTVIGDLADGLNALRELSLGKTEDERLRATGKCDITQKSLPICLPTRAASQTSPVASDCTKTVNDSSVSHREEPVEQGGSCTSGHRSTPFCTNNGEGGIRTRDTGVNPYDGLANRWFQPLTHLSNLPCVLSSRTPAIATD